MSDAFNFGSSPIANRTKCEDFGKFEPLFRQVQSDIETGARETRPFARKSEIEEGRYFIVGGQIAVVAEKGEVYVNAQNMSEARLRVIFDNGTESNMLMRSLQRALHKDDLGRRITDPVAGPLFGGEKQEGDNESGTIYVLRSKSEHPAIAANRDVIHKIGVTGGDVKTRISSAGKQATFLLADVELVATYELYNINRKKLEKLLHRFLASARLDLEIEDRFGQRVKPQEWFVVPLTVVNEVVERLHDQTLSRYRYDRETASLVRE